MIIRNKFNGYGFDGIRLCHDPVTLAMAAKAGTAATTVAPTLATVGTTLAPTVASTLPTVVASGSTLPTTAAFTGKLVTPAATSTVGGGGIAAGGVGGGAGGAGITAGGTGTLPAAGTPFTPPTVTPPATPLPPAGPPPVAPPTAGGPLPPTAPPTSGPLPPAGGPPVSPADMAARQAELESARQNAARELAARGGPPKGPAAQSEFVPKEKLLSQSVTDAQAASQKVADVGTSYYDKVLVPEGIGAKLPTNPLLEGAKAGLELVKKNPLETGLLTMGIGQYMNRPKGEGEDKDKYKSTVDMSEFRPSIPEQPSFTRSYEYQRYQSGGPVEDMSRMNSIGANTGFPMARLQTPAYAVSSATPMPVNTLTPSADASVNAYTGEPRFAEGGISAAERREYGLSTRGQRASRNLSKSYEEMEEARQKEAMKLFGERSDPGIVPRSRTQMLSSPFSAAMAEHARLGKRAKVPVVEMPKTNLGDIDNYMDIPIEAASGGIMHGLGGYSDGGRLLRGPGDGVSDSIPAVIGKRQPARLADGEFVIPARIVSELGNGSTEAGARKLYAMMERVQRARKKSIGKKKVAVNSKADKHLPA